MSDYKAIVNVGGGVAALGHRTNTQLIPTGVNKQLPSQNYPNLGVVHYFGDAGVPIINIYDIRLIAQRYQLPIAQLPLPEVGRGKVFEYHRYNLGTAAIALLLMLAILAVVKYFDIQVHKWREEKIKSEASARQ